MKFPIKDTFYVISHKVPSSVKYYPCFQTYRTSSHAAQWVISIALMTSSRARRPRCSHYLVGKETIPTL